MCGSADPAPPRRRAARSPPVAHRSPPPISALCPPLGAATRTRPTPRSPPVPLRDPRRVSLGNGAYPRKRLGPPPHGRPRPVTVPRSHQEEPCSSNASTTRASPRRAISSPARTAAGARGRSAARHRRLSRPRPASRSADRRRDRAPCPCGLPLRDARARRGDGRDRLCPGGGGEDWQYDFPAERLHDGDTIELGAVTITARHTPGTPRSISRSSSPTPPSRRAPGISSAGTSSSRAIWGGRICWTRRPV